MGYFHCLNGTSLIWLGIIIISVNCCKVKKSFFSEFWFLDIHPAGSQVTTLLLKLKVQLQQ